MTPVFVLELAGQADAFAAAEAATAAADVDPLAPGIATATAIDPDRVRRLAFTHRASELLGTTEGGVAGATALLEATSIDRTGTVAVRGRDVRGSAGVDTQAVEQALGGVLVERGLAVDLEAPDHELRAVFAEDVVALGWLAVEADRGFGERAPTAKPFFQPGSMDPIEARAVVNLAGAAPGATVLDPMCGTGGLLVEAGLVGATVLGLDVQPRMARGARQNLAAFLDDGWTVGVADAGRLPLVDDAVDVVVFDTPYGRQSKVAGADATSVVEAALTATHRVADRGVLVADRSRRDEAEAAGWTVAAVFERPVHRSLTRYVHVLA